MKSPLITIIIITSMILISCNQAKKDSGKTKQDSVPSLIKEQNKEERTNPADTVEARTTMQASTKEDTEEIMLNPPHGEPNHRCDIPVGAPLNSSQAEQKTDAEVMLNPPHGEPNHRCDIPVGEPLNSSPTRSSSQTTSRQVQPKAPDLANNPTAPTIENAKRLNSTRTRSTTTPATGEKPRLNPAHGQPWHRCDIAVGSPLP